MVIAASFWRVLMILLFWSTIQLVVEHFCMSIITSDDSKYIIFVKARHSELMYDLGPLCYFLEILLVLLLLMSALLRLL